MKFLKFLCNWRILLPAFVVFLPLIVLSAFQHRQRDEYVSRAEKEAAKTKAEKYKDLIAENGDIVKVIAVRQVQSFAVADFQWSNRQRHSARIIRDGQVAVTGDTWKIEVYQCWGTVWFVLKELVEE